MSGQTPKAAPLFLRVLLGLTFIYAGLQKLLTAGFFDPRNPASITAQMSAAARTSPIHALVAPLVPHAALVGHAIAYGEVAVGASALFGLFTRLAAVGGAALSVSFWLTVNAHVSPYFFVPDIPWAALWVVLWMLGPGEYLALDIYLGNLSPPPAPPGPAWPSQGAWSSQHPAQPFSRRQILGFSLAAGGLVVAALAVMRFKHLWLFASNTGDYALPVPQISGAPGGQESNGSSTASAGPSRSSQPARPAGQQIGTVAALRVGGSLRFTHRGSPAIALRPSQNSYLGLSMVCTHAGCIVDPPAAGKMICRCHGSVFSANTGAVQQGPASTPLPRITITALGGKLYAS